MGHKTIFKFMTATRWKETDVQPNLIHRDGEIAIKFNLDREPTEYKAMNNCEIYPFDEYL